MSNAPLDSLAIVAAAGGGKTTRIVNQVLANSNERAAILTYTKVNTEELTNKLYAKAGSIPAHVEVSSWFTFLLREMARPYRNAMHHKRIAGMLWTEKRSVPYVPKARTAQFFFFEGNRIYSDKVAHFVVECNKATNGAVIARLEDRFDHIYVDEVQDLAAYDLEVLKLLLRSKIKITLVGDHRQSTYATNHSALHQGFRGIKIIDKFHKWQKAKLLDVRFETQTHRCNQIIADLADTLFPDIPRTESLNFDITEHDGLFAVPSNRVLEYFNRYTPQVLRFSKSTKCFPVEAGARNFGECKGLTFDRVLIYPHGAALKWLQTGDIKHVTDKEISLAKLYVAITRARYSVAFVMDKPSVLPSIKSF